MFFTIHSFFLLFWCAFMLQKKYQYILCCSAMFVQCREHQECDNDLSGSWPPLSSATSNYIFPLTYDPNQCHCQCYKPNKPQIYLLRAGRFKKKGSGVIYLARELTIWFFVSFPVPFICIQFLRVKGLNKHLRWNNKICVSLSQFMGTVWKRYTFGLSERVWGGGGILQGYKISLPLYLEISLYMLRTLSSQHNKLDMTCQTCKHTWTQVCILSVLQHT